MIRVNIDYKEKEIEVLGHSNNIVCSRISTLMQYTHFLFEDSKVFKHVIIKNGYSIMSFNEEGTILFDKLVKTIKKLKEMYSSNIMIYER